MGTKHQQLVLLLLGALMLRASLAASSVEPASAVIVDPNANKPVGPDYGIGALNRTTFPKGFLFGTGSAAYQFEGAAFEDGKGPSIWDTFTHKLPGKIADRSTGDVALDQYHRYKEDVQLLKEMGVDSYRFSISWPRVLPHGKVSKGVNPKGIAYYHNLIDELLANGITPFVTIFHWDLPQALEDEYGGFLSPLIVEDFENYADLCFREYGGKVKHWTTLNEPLSYSMNGYARGTFAPGRCSAWQDANCTGGDSATEPYIVSHHLILAHAAAVHLYRTKYQASQKGIIGITLVTHWFLPYTDAQHDQNAAARALDFFLGWFMNPISKGDYPRSMRSLVKGRLPRFTAAQFKLVKGSFDFLGLNYYTTQYAKYDSKLRAARPSFLTDNLASETVVKNGVPIGPPSASDWLRVYPQGLRLLLLYIKKTYDNPPVYITENGIDEFQSDPLEKAVNDKARVLYHHDHLAYMNLAIKEGANVKGYFAWSFLDDFEWDAGYTVGFGTYVVDHKNGRKRIPKLSAHWYKKFLQK